MKLLEIAKNDYFKLFVRREGVVVLGKNYSNLWLLTSVLVATFLAIAFSNGSMDYLDYKMNDPFINWVDIQNEYEEGDFEGLSYALGDESNAEQFHYKGYQSDYRFSYFFFGIQDDITQYLKCRFFGQMNTQLVKAILEEDNVVENSAVSEVESMSDDAIGIIITKDAIEKLGYSYPFPSYVDLYSYSPGADTCGIWVDYQNRSRAPIPVLGVVKRLPGNVDVISSVNFYTQATNDISHPFNLSKSEYGKSLKFFLPEDVDFDGFSETVTNVISSYNDTLRFEIDPYGFFPSEQINFKFQQGKGTFVQIESLGDDFPFDLTSSLVSEIEQKYSDKDIHRLYEYGNYFRDCRLNSQAYISVHFSDLNRIREFEAFANQYKVKIEMAQINAKENFNAVRRMANVLSWVMIAFAIVCIILFIVNLLQSYFQKVKRNLGTFKAFGIGNVELISIYMLIMLSIVIASILIALIAVEFIQVLLPLFGIMKEGEFNYLDLWNGMTVWSVVIILAASFFTVYKVMGNLLKQTPGDLIYDRQ